MYENERPMPVPAGHTVVERDDALGILVSRDRRGKLHRRMRADPMMLVLGGGKQIQCGHSSCSANVLLTNPPSDAAKGWQHHPTLGWRGPCHPWQ